MDLSVFRLDAGPMLELPKQAGPIEILYLIRNYVPSHSAATASDELCT